MLSSPEHEARVSDSVEGGGKEGMCDLLSYTVLYRLVFEALDVGLVFSKEGDKKISC